MKKKIGFAVRMILTAILLVIVWQNSHWSVALFLTLLAITNELESAYMDRIETILVLNQLKGLRK